MSRKTNPIAFLKIAFYYMNMGKMLVEYLIDFHMSDQFAISVRLPIYFQNLALMRSIKPSEADHSSARIDTDDLTTHEEAMADAKRICWRYCNDYCSH